MLKVETEFEYGTSLVGSLVLKKLECTSGGGNTFVVVFGLLLLLVIWGDDSVRAVHRHCLFQSKD